MTPARDPKQVFSEPTCRIMEERSMKRNPGRGNIISYIIMTSYHHLGYLGPIWETFGKHLGSFLEASGI